MSENTRFMDRNGKFQDGVRLSGRHVKWTLSSIMNLIVNCILAVVTIIGVNTIAGNEDSTHLSREGTLMNFVSADSDAKTVTIMVNGVEENYVAGFEGFTNTESFIPADEETSAFLTRCTAFDAYHNGSTDEQVGPSHQVKTFFPRLQMGSF